MHTLVRYMVSGLTYLPTELMKFFTQMGRVDGYNPQMNKKDTAFTWTNVYEKNNTSSGLGNTKSFQVSCFVLLNYLCICLHQF